MGLFTAKKQLPTDTHLASLNNNAATQSSSDPEKGTTHEDDVVGAANGEGGGGQNHHVDPVIEKRVVRKLDLTVTPLQNARWTAAIASGQDDITDEQTLTRLASSAKEPCELSQRERRAHKTNPEAKASDLRASVCISQYD